MRNQLWLLLVIGVFAALWSGTVWAVETGILTTEEMIFKSSELGSLNVFDRTAANAKLGHLSDLIIDSHTGQVLYGILDTGIGGKYVTVPWNAFLLQEDAANRKSWLTLDKTSDELKTAPAFDMSNPPNFANVQWRDHVDSVFGVRTVARPTDAGQLTANEMIFRSSQLEGLNVVNRADSKLGHLSDLIVDAHTGQVLYGILNTGFGGKYIPVPWSVFQVQQKENKSSLALNKTSDELKNAPSVDLKTMPDFTSAAWKGSVDRFFGVRTAARPMEPIE